MFVKRASLFAAFLFAGAFLRAQTPTGEITGTITDATGAAIAGATVSATNSGTGSRRAVTSNDSGVYSLPSLTPGNYSLRVETKGFKAGERRDVELQVGQVDRLGFTMEVGNTSDTIEVAGGAPVIETENASIGTVIENRRIIDLPLNGRNPLQLVSLTPGATTNGPASSQGQQRMGGARNQFSLNVSGQRTSFNHYSLDGVENTDPNFNTYLFLPSVDALQEFKVESGTYGAEYGRGLSQVNITTKSGTNEFHGALFEFLRNSQLDAKNFFDPKGPIAPFKRNQFGATVGGPVWIPKLFNGRNKLFFFFDYEGLRERKALTNSFNMPYALDRVGNFSGSSAVIYDPLTRVVDSATGKVISESAFPGNIIPANRISPISTEVFKRYFPLPNQGAPGIYTANYVDNEGRRNDNDQWTLRGDYVMNASSTIQARYSHTHDTGYLPLTTPGLGYNNDVGAHQGMIGHVLVLGANKVNEFKFSISRLVAANQQPSANTNNVVQQLGIAGVQTSIPEYWGVPVFQFSGISTVGECSDCPFVNWDTLFQWTDNFSWTRGTHSFKFGTDSRRMRYNQLGAVVARGRFSFNGTYTADPNLRPVAPQNSIADFLLGDINVSEGQTGAPIANFRGVSLNFYAQDSWKITSKLTVNYGLRYEFEPPYLDAHDAIVNIAFKWDNTMLPEYVRAGNGDPYQGNPPFKLPATVPYVRNGMFGRRAYEARFNNWAPRAGVAYSLNSKTVIRSGAGIYYVRDIGNAQFDLVRNAPYSTRRSENANSNLV
ncbi:MAG: carboxypeptidase-like regulatory domain-containing protein, partial [Acidobacteriota bacterium]|nr:carboxypeptidase-like regulatory domain-containing protein [Acidobacteriota bacterium]